MLGTKETEQVNKELADNAHALKLLIVLPSVSSVLSSRMSAFSKGRI
jgi:hypothetical protein